MAKTTKALKATDTTSDKSVAKYTGIIRYFAVTRGPWYSFVFVLPILIAYEVLIWGTHSDTINGADAIMSAALAPLLNLLGVPSREIALCVIVFIGGIVCFLEHRARYAGRDDGKLNRRYFAYMIAESAVYALCFGSVVTSLTHMMTGFGGGLSLGYALQVATGPEGGPKQSLGMCLGAGIYEELFFRVLLMGGFVAIARRLHAGPVLAWLAGAVFSAVIFSAFHYIGSAAYDFTWASFMFRFGSGIVLAAIYGVRGFGVAVWTHALYDTFLMMHGA